MDVLLLLRKVVPMRPIRLWIYPCLYKVKSMICFMISLIISVTCNVPMIYEWRTHLSRFFWRLFWHFLRQPFFVQIYELSVFLSCSFRIILALVVVICYLFCSLPLFFLFYFDHMPCCLIFLCSCILEGIHNRWSLFLFFWLLLFWYWSLAFVERMEMYCFFLAARSEIIPTIQTLCISVMLITFLYGLWLTINFLGYEDIHI